MQVILSAKGEYVEPGSLPLLGPKLGQVAVDHACANNPFLESSSYNHPCPQPQCSASYVQRLSAGRSKVMLWQWHRARSGQLAEADDKCMCWHI